jgi:hypothetical protein
MPSRKIDFHAIEIREIGSNVIQTADQNGNSLILLGKEEHIICVPSENGTASILMNAKIHIRWLMLPGKGIHDFFPSVDG